MKNRNILAESVRRALWLGVAGTSMLGATAFAQDDAKETKTLDSVQVTGSRIARTETETASPVFQITREAIEKSGALTIGDFIQDVPAISGAATNPTVNNGGGTGAATISLRGLTENRTLLLINGRRIVTNDVNSIPMSMVDRIEILKDGASAIYGSDAVGGVVNFILKKKFDGIETTLSYGSSSRGDGDRLGVSSTLGLSNDRGSIILSANYSDQKEVKSSDRDYSTFALSLSSGVVTVGGSSRTTTGRYAVAESIVGLDCNADGDLLDTANLTHRAGTPGTAVGDFRCFAGSDFFNYQAVGNLQLTPQERAGVFISGNYDITENVTGYFDAFVNKTRSASQIAPLPFDGRPANDNVVISRFNIYNPFGVDIIDSRLRLSALGNRRYEYSSDVNQVTAGLKGAFGDTSWTWDTNFSYGKINQDQTTSGYIQSSLLTNALGPSYIDGTGPHCGTVGSPIANCVPLNFFNVPFDTSTAAGQAQVAALAAITVNSSTKLSQWYRGFQANFSGDLFEMSAGMVKGAFGVEYRDNRLEFTPDSLTRLQTTDFTCEISSEACASQTSGSQNSKEFYGEVLFPLVADAPWAKSLNLTLGTRYSDFNTFGTTLNSKLGIEWRPSDELLVRASYAEVFRAPTINDLFGGVAAFSATFTDPCNGYTGVLNANPACQNVINDGSFAQSDTQLSAYLGGNSSLQPEQGTVFTYGFVYEPSWLEGFSTTVDIWKVHLDDTIYNYGTATILQQCFASTLASPSPFCSLFSRDTNGEIIRVFDNQANVGVTDTNGVDFGMKYRFNTSWGDFRASVDTTYTDRYDLGLVVGGNTVGVITYAGQFVSPANGGLGNYSRWRGLGSLDWKLGNWDAQWTARYIHGFYVGGFDQLDICASAGSAPGSAECRFRRGANTYHNLQLGYSYKPWNMKLRLGVDNVFDKQPPIVYQNNSLNGNTDERTFDTVGRYYWFSGTFTFN